MLVASVSITFPIINASVDSSATSLADNGQFTPPITDMSYVKTGQEYSTVLPSIHTIGENSITGKLADEKGITSFASPNGIGVAAEAVAQSYEQYRFFVGNIWTEQTSENGAMSVTFDGVSNTIEGLMPNDWIKVLPINIAYGTNTSYSWIQFAVDFRSTKEVDFYLEQNNFANGAMDFGYEFNGRMWDTSFSGDQKISVSHTVGHTFFASVAKVDNTHVQFSIDDEDTRMSWSITLPVPNTDVLHNPGAGGNSFSFSPATTVEGLIGTSITSITGLPYFEIDIRNSMSGGYHYVEGFLESDRSVHRDPPSGVECQASEISSDGWWRWVAISDKGLLPMPKLDRSDVVYQSSINLGQTATIDVSIDNYGGDASWMTTQISFPNYQPVTLIVVDTAGTTVPNTILHPAGYFAPLAYGFRIGSNSDHKTTSYPFVEGGGYWQGFAPKHLKVQVTPSMPGSFKFLVKSVAANQSRAISWSPAAVYSGSEKDQQSEYAYNFTINVGVSQSNINVNVDSPSINLGGGTAISGSVTSSVSGDKSGTIHLQYSTNSINWNSIGSTQSDSSGYYSYWWTPSSIGTFYVRSYWNGNNRYGGATSNPVVLNVNPTGGNLVDHTMCKGVQPADPWEPITRTNTFYTDDSAAYSWVKFADIHDGPHFVHWDWYYPDGRSWTWDETIPPPQPGYYYESYKLWSYLSPLHFADSELGKTFMVRVFYDGHFVVTETWTIIKHQSSIATSLPFSLITYGQSITVGAQISPSVSDGTTTLQYSVDGVNWNNFASGTPANGYYSSTWSPPSAGTYYFRAVWNGNLDNYGATSSSQTLDVVKVPTALTTSLSATYINYGSLVTIAASMFPPRQGKTLEIQYSIDNTNWVFLSSGNTNQNGQYTYSWAPAAGTVYFRSTWSGDNNYDGATSSSQTITVITQPVSGVNLNVNVFDESGYSPASVTGTKRLTNMPVKVYSLDDSLVASGVSGSSGIASFILTEGTYDVVCGSSSGADWGGMWFGTTSKTVQVSGTTMNIDIYCRAVTYHSYEAGRPFELNYLDLDRNAAGHQDGITVRPGQQVNAEFSWWELETVNVPVWYVSVFGSWNPTTPLGNLKTGVASPTSHNLHTVSLSFIAPSEPGTYEIRLMGVLDYAWPNSYYTSFHYNPSLGRDMGPAIISKSLDGPYGIATIVVSEPETTLFLDNFESYPVGTFPSSGGWELVFNGMGDQYQVITNSYSASPSKSLQLWGNPNDWSAAAQKRFTSTSRYIGYEVSMMVSAIGNGGPGRVDYVGFYNRDVATWGRTYASIQFNHDTKNIITDDGSIVGTWVPGSWYTVKVILDKNTKTYSVWVNGQLKGSAYAVGNQDIENINALKLESDHPGVKDYFDDVRIFEIQAVPTQNVLKFTLGSPANILVTAPNGLRVGYDSATGTVVNEISGATYTGPGTEPQEITIPNPLPGAYIIDIIGTGSGPYTITVKSVAPDGSTIDTVTFTGTTSPGETSRATTQLFENGEIIQPVFNVIPEVPLGTILTSATMIIGLATYFTLPKLRKKKK